RRGFPGAARLGTACLSTALLSDVGAQALGGDARRERGQQGGDRRGVGLGGDVHQGDDLLGHQRAARGVEHPGGRGSGESELQRALVQAGGERRGIPSDERVVAAGGGSGGGV